MDFSSNHYASCLGWPGIPATADPSCFPHGCCCCPGFPHLQPGLYPLLLVTTLLVLSLVYDIISDSGINLRVILSFNLLSNTEASWFVHKFF